jgi:cell division protein FtsB
MGLSERIWGAFTSVIKLEDRVQRQGDALKSQQQKLEDLTERMIRLEAQIEMLMSAAVIKRIKG